MKAPAELVARLTYKIRSNQGMTGEGSYAGVTPEQYSAMTAVLGSRQRALQAQAAPDMLEALYAIAGDAAGQHADPLRVLEHIRVTARAAITKATGEVAHG